MLSTKDRRGKSFRDAGSRIFQQETETQAGIITLLSARTPTAVREIPIDKGEMRKFLDKINANFMK